MELMTWCGMSLKDFQMDAIVEKSKLRLLTLFWEKCL